MGFDPSFLCSPRYCVRFGARLRGKAGRNLEPRIARMPRIGITEKELPRRNGLDLAAGVRRGERPTIERSNRRSIRRGNRALIARYPCNPWLATPKPPNSAEAGCEGWIGEGGYLLFLLFLTEFLKNGISAQRIPDRIKFENGWRSWHWAVKPTDVRCL